MNSELAVHRREVELTKSNAFDLALRALEDCLRVPDISKIGDWSHPVWILESRLWDRLLFPLHDGIELAVDSRFSVNPLLEGRG